MKTSKSTKDGYARLIEAISDASIKNIDRNVSKYGSTIEHIIAESLLHHMSNILGDSSKASELLSKQYSSECKDMVVDVISSDIMTSIVYAISLKNNLK